MEENEELKEAVEKLDTLSEDERMQRIADLRQKAIMDEKAIYDKGLDDGELRGIEKGIKQGKEEGIKEKTIDIAKNMIKENIDINLIEKLTGLSKEKIEQLKQEIQ